MKTVFGFTDGTGECLFEVAINAAVNWFEDVAFPHLGRNGRPDCGNEENLKHYVDRPVRLINLRLRATNRSALVEIIEEAYRQLLALAVDLDGVCNATSYEITHDHVFSRFSAKTQVSASEPLWEFQGSVIDVKEAILAVTPINDSADNDDNENSFSSIDKIKHPQNPDVIDLCKKLAAEYPRGRPLIEIAREFVTENGAVGRLNPSNLLRQAQRYPHLWKPVAR